MRNIAFALFSTFVMIHSAIAADIGTAFTYQGFLERPAGMPVGDTCDFRFGLWDAAAGGNQVGNSPQTMTTVAVTAGVFTTVLDFGPAAINGAARWLEIEVQCSGDPDFILLLGRVELTPAPHALALPGLYTQQNPNSPNVIGGFNGNTIVVGVEGATISGGGTFNNPNRVEEDYATVCGGQKNSATGRYAVVGGGTDNTASGQFSTVAGGFLNTAGSSDATVSGGTANSAIGLQSTIGGGQNNVANSYVSTVGGGGDNQAASSAATVAGGQGNKAQDFYATVSGGVNNTAALTSATVSGGNGNTAGGIYSTVPGGRDNQAAADYSFAAGRRAKAEHPGAHVWADSTNADFTSTGPNQFLIRAAGGVGINTNSPSATLHIGGAPSATNGIRFPDGTLLTSAVSATGDLTPDTIADDGVISDAEASDMLTIDNGLLFAPTSGGVGIGTTSPVSLLDVNGDVRASRMHIIGGSPTTQTVLEWGDNTYGQTTVPEGLLSAAAVGKDHSIAIRADGTLIAWGDNSEGESDVPAGTFIAVAAGDDFSIAIRTNGILVGWGRNLEGQINVPGGTYVAVAAGSFHGLGIRSDGTLAGWGLNNHGQTSVPTGSFTSVAAGIYHSVAIKSDGTLAAWGYNLDGQTIVPAGTFMAISSHGWHSLALRTDGTLSAWGWNLWGQTNAPAGSFTGIAAGNSHSVAIRSDGTLDGWGNNGSGQIEVPAGTFTFLAAGGNNSLAMTSPTTFGLLLANDSAAKPGSNTWTISSDRRLKKNIVPLSGALDRLLQLRGVHFEWLDPSSQGGITGTQIGLIADEVQKAFPQWVGHDPKGYQTLTVGGFEALTAEALRELRNEKDCELEVLRAEHQSELDQLRRRESEKDRRIADLETRLAAIEASLARSSGAEKRNRP